MKDESHLDLKVKRSTAVTAVIYSQLAKLALKVSLTGYLSVCGFQANPWLPPAEEDGKVLMTQLLALHDREGPSDPGN